MLFYTFILLILANNLAFSDSSLIEDDNGYILYCPCMGRFGNQADHFLGAFAFSKALNRTLVLPPWIEYRYGELRSIQVPFDTYFRIDELNEYHRTITMEQFMKDLAPKIWPAKERISFCYMARTGHSTESCNAKEGNPFGPFWDTFDVDFEKSEFYGPLNYDIRRPENLKKWKTKYPAKKWPVLAFTGAPGSFPVQAENLHIHQYLKWSDTISSQAHDYIRSTMNGGGFVGIHLRNGADWVRACQHVAESPRLFSAPQCVGYQNEKGLLTPSMCFPTKQDIVRQLKRVIKQVREVKHIFVASDANHMLSELQEALKRSNVTIHRLEPSNPHLDLAVLARANHFIGNCISSFSAFVKRERDSTGLPSSFWAFPPHKSARHDEL